MIINFIIFSSSNLRCQCCFSICNCSPSFW